MDGIIIGLLILIPFIYLVLLLAILNRTSSLHKLTEVLYDKIKELNNKVSALSQEVKKPAETTIQKTETINETIVKTEIIEKVEPVEEIKPIPVPEPEKETPVASIPEIKKIQPEIITPQKVPAHQPAPKQSWWETWLQKNPDMEKFIGENLANKIGIAVLVLGIAFFVKFAIDKNWINETGRVIIGLVCGGILIGVAHYFRKTYRSFSSVLVGGGLTVFYFTIAFAFHQYSLISQQAAFVIMLIITAFAVVLALLYDRLELAVLATIGGFITPFLISNGQNNYVALFTYLTILNAGLMILAWFKKWTPINFIGLFFTLIIYGGWLSNELFIKDPVAFPFKNAMLFATVFYFQFIIMNIINNLRVKRTFNAFDFIVLLSTNFLYYAAGITILQFWNNGDFKGLFTAGLGAINLLLAFIFYHKANVDKNFVFLLIGLTLTFISLAAPVQLHGNYITLFWSAEIVVLFWLYQQSRIVLLKITSLIISGLMIISLLMDWSQIYISGSALIPIMANKGFITGIVATASMFIFYLLMKKEADSYYLNGITNRSVRDFLLSAGIILIYLSGALEIYYQFNTRINTEPIYLIYLQLFSFVFAFGLLKVFRNQRSAGMLRFALTFLCFAVYLINIRSNYDISFNMLHTGAFKLHFIAHWLAAVVLFKLLYDLIMFFRKNKITWSGYQNSFTWISTASLLILLSIEMYHIVLWTNFSQKEDWEYWENLYYKAGLSILWGVCAFIMIWLGMKYSFRTLRIISLTLFTITLAKLFLYDISNIPPGGKIAAFILLGVLLLVISFMYQRLKKIIIDDGKKDK
ncbi:MAG: DUF2339 domain-containing protein [Bacteroidetes bacterium]|nr:DUF2339 domain-containing protein [Bacteroidota bacterium]